MQILSAITLHDSLQARISWLQVIRHSISTKRKQILPAVFLLMSMTRHFVEWHWAKITLNSPLVLPISFKHRRSAKAKLKSLKHVHLRRCFGLPITLELANPFIAYQSNQNNHSEPLSDQAGSADLAQESIFYCCFRAVTSKALPV